MKTKIFNLTFAIIFMLFSAKSNAQCMTVFSNGLPLSTTVYSAYAGTTLPPIVVQKYKIINNCPSAYYVPNVMDNLITSTGNFILNQIQVIKLGTGVIKTEYPTLNMTSGIGLSSVDTVAQSSTNSYEIIANLSIPPTTLPGNYTLQSVIQGIYGLVYPGYLLTLGSTLNSDPIVIKVMKKPGKKIGLMEGKEEISIFPNPASDVIQVTNLEDEKQYKVIDLITGRTIKTGSVSQNQNKISIGDIPKGMYLLQLNENIIKFVKN